MDKWRNSSILEVLCNLIITIILLIHYFNLLLCSVYLRELILLVASLLSNKKWLPDFLSITSPDTFPHPQVPSFLLHLYCSLPRHQYNSLYAPIHRILTEQLELTERRFAESCFPMRLFYKQTQHVQLSFSTFHTVCSELLCKRSRILFTSCIFYTRSPSRANWV